MTGLSHDALAGHNGLIQASMFRLQMPALAHGIDNEVLVLPAEEDPTSDFHGSSQG